MAFQDFKGHLLIAREKGERFTSANFKKYKKVKKKKIPCFAWS